MTCGYIPGHIQSLGNADITEWSSRKGKYFLRVEPKSCLQMVIPPSISLDGASGHALYSISMCFRFPTTIPSQGAAVLGAGSLVVRATQTGIMHLQGLSSSADFPTRKCFVQGNWSVVTLTVDVAEKHAVLWVDGNLVQEERNIEGLCEIRDKTVHVLGCQVALCSKAVSGIQSVRADLRMVQIDTCMLCASDVFSIHVPFEVWTCACGARNGESFSTCQQETCGAKRKKSASRPKGDGDPTKPGLTIVVNESFKDIVLNKRKHVFLYLTRENCSSLPKVGTEWASFERL
jgi:hypothetical protein